MSAFARGLPLALLLAVICAGPALADPRIRPDPTGPAVEARRTPLPHGRDGGLGHLPPERHRVPRAFAPSKAAAQVMPGARVSPPEYGPTAGVLFRYSRGEWSAEVTDLVAALTGDPAHDETAWVIVGSTRDRDRARSDFESAGADLGRVQFIVMPSDSVWIRDYGPGFVWQDGARVVVDSHYYSSRPLDNFVPTLLAEDYFGEPVRAMGLYQPGGNFMASADGHGFTTSLVELINPGFGAGYIAELYGEYHGIDTLHILPRLPSSVDGTAHIDMWFYLVDEDTVVISEFLPGSNPDAIAITDSTAAYMEQVLGYEVFRVPDHNGPHPWHESAHFTYTNAFRVNDRIFIPSYGTGGSDHPEWDAQALAVWQAAAPDAEIVPIDSWDLIWADGAIHCIVKQVPRYTAPTPSAALLSPVGGELLVPGALHEVAWAASDDQGVVGVDLLFSTDGGASYPATIALGADHVGRLLWTVPDEETASARVKLVARDAEANQAESASASDFSIRHALQHVYDFATGAGQDRWAWGHETASWAALNGVRRPTSAASEVVDLDGGAYADLSASDAVGDDGDGNRYRSPIPGSGAESTHLFEFVIEEDPALIRDIGLFWEGYGDACLQVELYVWDDVANQWGDGRGLHGENRYVDNRAGNRDARLEGHIRSDFGRYVGGDGKLTLLLYAERPAQETFHDYVAVTVTHLPDSDLDGAPDGEDCAPLDAQSWAVAGEVTGLRLDHAGGAAGTTTLTWDPPVLAGATAPTYDLLVSAQAGEFADPAECVESGDGADTAALDPGAPAPGAVRHYLVRAVNGCGAGSAGAGSTGLPRPVGGCP